MCEQSGQSVRFGYNPLDETAEVRHAPAPQSLFRNDFRVTGITCCLNHEDSVAALHLRYKSIRPTPTENGWTERSPDQFTSEECIGGSCTEELTCLEPVQWPIFSASQQPLTGIEFAYQDGLKDVLVHFGDTENSMSVCGSPDTSIMATTLITVSAPLVSFYSRWSPQRKQITALRAYYNDCAINEHSAYDLSPLSKPLAVQLSDRQLLDKVGANYFADFALPGRPTWVQEKEYASTHSDHFQAYTCDYSLKSILTGDPPTYLSLQPSESQSTMVRFSRSESDWPLQIQHDRIIVLCNVAGTEVTVKSSFDVIFYEFDFAAEEALPANEKCFHVANQVAQNPKYLPAIDSQWRDNSYWYHNASLLLQCCRLQEGVITTINGVLLLASEEYNLEDESNETVSCHITSLQLAQLEYLFFVQKDSTQENITYRDIYYKNFQQEPDSPATSLCTGYSHNVEEERSQGYFDHGSGQRVTSIIEEIDSKEHGFFVAWDFSQTDQQLATNIYWWTNRCVFTPEAIDYDKLKPQFAQMSPNAPEGSQLSLQEIGFDTHSENEPGFEVSGYSFEAFSGYQSMVDLNSFASNARYITFQEPFSQVERLLSLEKTQYDSMTIAKYDQSLALPQKGATYQVFRKSTQESQTVRFTFSELVLILEVEQQHECFFEDTQEPVPTQTFLLEEFSDVFEIIVEIEKPPLAKVVCLPATTPISTFSTTSLLIDGEDATTVFETVANNQSLIGKVIELVQTTRIYNIDGVYFDQEEDQEYLKSIGRLISEESAVLGEFKLESNCVLKNNFVLQNMEIGIGDPQVLTQSLTRDEDSICPQMQIQLITTLPDSVLNIQDAQVTLTGLNAQSYEGVWGPYIILSVEVFGQMYATDFAIFVVDRTIECSLSQQPESQNFPLLAQPDQFTRSIQLRAFPPDCQPKEFPHKVFFQVVPYFQQAVYQSALLTQLDYSLFQLTLQDPSLIGEEVQLWQTTKVYDTRGFDANASEQELQDADRLVQQIDSLRANIQIVDACEVLQIRKLDLRDMQILQTPEDVTDRQPLPPIQDTNGLIQSGLCPTPPVTIEANLPEAYELELVGNKIVFSQIQNMTTPGQNATTYRATLQIQVSDKNIYSQQFSVIVQPFSDPDDPLCIIQPPKQSSTLAPQPQNTTQSHEYFLERQDPMVKQLNFTLYSVSCKPGQSSSLTVDSTLKAYENGADGQKTDITRETILFIDPKTECQNSSIYCRTREDRFRKPFFIFQTDNPDFAGKNITIVQETTLSRDPSDESPNVIEYVRQELHVVSMCDSIEVEPLQVQDMQTFSGSQEAPLAQEVIVPADNFDLLNRELCGRLSLVLRPALRNKQLPLEIFDRVGFTLQLDGSIAHGFEGEYVYFAQLYLGDYGQVQETKFSVTISHQYEDSETENENNRNSAPIFIDTQISDGNYLPGVEAPVQRVTFLQLPKTYDPNNDTVKTFLTPASPLLVGCNCFSLTSSNPAKIRVDLPFRLWGNVVTFQVTLRDTYARTDYYLNVTAVRPPVSPPPVPSPPKNDSSIDLALVEFFVQKLMGKDEVENFAPNYEFSYFKNDSCVPLSTKVTREGEVIIKFARDFFVEPADNLVEVVKRSGSIQVQLLDSGLPNRSNKKDFDWTFSVREKRNLVVSLLFEESGAISSSSNDYDLVRVIFVDTKAFLRCETVADLYNPSKQERRMLQADDPNSIPKGFEVVANLPAQTVVQQIIQVQEVTEAVTRGTKAVVYSSIVLATFFNLSLQLLWGGINALQIIAHLPLNNVNFPVNAFYVFRFLAEVVSFDLFAPTDYYDFGFTETEPFNSNYEELGYETTNFLENIGSISLIFLIIALRHIFQPPVFHLISKCGCCKCWRNFQTRVSLSVPKVTSTWVRFGLETYFEFIISCLIGIKLASLLKDQQQTHADTLAIVLCYIFFALIVLFPLMVAFFTLCLVRPYVHVQKTLREAANAEALRKVAETTKHKEQIQYGPHLFFRQESELVTKPALTIQTISSSSDQQQAGQQQLSQDLHAGKQMSQPVLPDLILKSRSEKDNLQRAPISARKTQIVPSDQLQTIQEDDSTSKRKTEKLITTRLSGKKQENFGDSVSCQEPNLLINEAALIKDYFLRNESMPSIASQSQQSSPRKVRSDPKSKEREDRNMTERTQRTIQSQTSFGSNSQVSHLKRSRVLVKRPDSLKKQREAMDYKWIAYLQTLFEDLKMHKMSAQPFYLIHLVRRIVFVIVAMFLFDHPWLQVLLYLVQSISMLSFIRNQLPFANKRTNFLEAYNELTVLITAYHLVLISGFEIEFEIRNQIGTSLIIFLVIMILVNFVLLLHDLIRSIIKLCQKCYYSRKKKKLIKKRSEQFRLKQLSSQLVQLQNHNSTKLNQVGLAPIAEANSSFSQSSCDNAIDSQPGQEVVNVEDEEDASFFRLKGLVYGEESLNNGDLLEQSKRHAQSSEQGGRIECDSSIPSQKRKLSSKHAAGELISSMSFLGQKLQHPILDEGAQLQTNPGREHGATRLVQRIFEELKTDRGALGLSLKDLDNNCEQDLPSSTQRVVTNETNEIGFTPRRPEEQRNVISTPICRGIVTEMSSPTAMIGSQSQSKRIEPQSVLGGTQMSRGQLEQVCRPVGSRIVLNPELEDASQDQIPAPNKRSRGAIKHFRSAKRAKQSRHKDR